MIVAARDADISVLLGVYLLAALVIAYLAPRLLGFIILVSFRALRKSQRARPRAQR